MEVEPNQTKPIRYQTTCVLLITLCFTVVDLTYFTFQVAFQPDYIMFEEHVCVIVLWIN